jgi:membrane associated rhomboid family serine protease
MLTELTNSLQLIALQTQLNAPNLLRIMLILWGTFIVTQCCPWLLILGITPRQWYGLPGIVFSPFLHANFNHLFFNSIPLLVLSNFLLIQGVPYYLWATFWITLISGLLVWTLGRPAIHIGASSVITGYWSFLITHAYEQGGMTAWILAGICVYYFMGIFLGVFPQEKGISWEGHLFGLIAGGLTAIYLL